MLGIRNGGVGAKFDAWNRKRRSSSPVPTIGIVNGKGGLLIIKGPTYYN